MKINVTDKIWDRKSFEVGGHWRCGMKKPNDHTESLKKRNSDVDLCTLSGSGRAFFDCEQLYMKVWPADTCLVVSIQFVYYKRGIRHT